MFDATAGPCPASRTSSFTPIDARSYQPRKGDSAAIADSRELRRDERLSLTGFPTSHKWPPGGERCNDPRCCAKGSRSIFELVGVMRGNVVSPQQAVAVLSRIGLKTGGDPFHDNGEHILNMQMPSKFIPARPKVKDKDLRPRLPSDQGT